jgi:type II secretory pathway pseudopilin PulG
MHGCSFHPPVHSGASPRGGFTLTEVVAAAGIISTLFVVAVPLLAHVRQVRKEADDRLIALNEAASALETLALAASRSELTARMADGLELSPAARRLADPRLSIEMSDGTPSPLGRRVTVSVRWDGDSGEPARPMVLSAWFAAEGDNP